MKESDFLISGQKGGGKGGGTPTTEPDSLDSLATVQILDVLSEGVIEGFPTPRDNNYAAGTTNYNKAALQDIYLDDTPIVQATADPISPEEEDYNYQDISLGFRQGLGTQSVIRGFADVRTEIGVGDLVTYGNPITKTDTTTGIDEAAVTISFPQFQLYEDDGDIKGSKVRVVIQVAYDGASFPAIAGDDTYVVNNLVEGRSGDLYQKTYRFNLENYSSQFQIRVTRHNEDGGSKNINAFSWFSYTRIIDQDLTYNNTALVGLKASSEDFQGIPRRSYMLRGVKCRVPSNSNPVASGQLAGRLNYSGSWDGTFITAYTTCPSWILYDLLTSQRYGSGDEILTAAEKANFNGNASNLDKYSFYSASTYANELVSNRRDAGTTPAAVWYQIAGRKSVRVIITGGDLKHKLQSNDFVNITFSTGQVSSLPANQTYKIDTRGSRQSFYCLQVATTPSAIAGATYSQSGGTITVTKTGHGYSVDCRIKLNFTSGNAKNGTFIILTVPNANSFTVNARENASSPTSGDVTFQSIGGTCAIVRQGNEPRFAFNGLINAAVPAFDLVNSICSTMRAMPYWSAGGLTLSIDKPTDVSYIFNNSNVLEGGFVYEGSDIKSRATLVVVKYFSNEKKKIDYVQDPINSDISSDSWISKYGINKKEVQAFGCTSSGQASRLARWIRFSENNLTQTVTFKTSIDAGVVVRPGAVIGISDKTIAGQRRGGRVRATTANTLTIDETSADLPYGRTTGTGTYAQSDTTITVTSSIHHHYEAGSRITLDFTSGSAVDNTFTILSSPAPTNTTFAVDYGSSGTNSGNVTYTCPFTRTLHVLMPDGSVDSNTVDWVAYPTSYAQINISGNFQVGGTDTLPNVNAPWILESSGGNSAENLQQTLWRVISVGEENSGTEFKITALEYNPSAYAHVEAGTDVTYRDATDLNEKPQRPETATITERLYKEILNTNSLTDTDQQKTNKGRIRSKIKVEWSEVRAVTSYLLRYRVNSANWQEVTVNGLDFEVLNVKAGDTFDFKIRAVSGGGKRSISISVSHTCAGKSDPPNNVSGLAVTVDPATGPILTWTENEPNPDSFDGTNPDVIYKDLDIAYYEIHKSNANNFGSKDSSTFVTREQAPDHVLGELITSSQTYYIKARDDGGRYSDLADSVTATISAPSVPTNLAGSIQGDAVVVTWTAPTVTSYNLKHYQIEVEGGSSFNIDTDEYTVPLTFTGNQRYRVRAKDIANQYSSWTSWLTVTNTSATISISTPSIEETFVDLKWSISNSPSTKVRAYRIKYGGTSWTDGAVSVGDIKATDYRVEATWTGARVFRIAALDANENEGFSSTVTVTINNPAAVSGGALVLDDDGIVLTWDELSQDTNNTGGFSLPTKFYKIKRGLQSQTFDQATDRGNIQGTTFTEKAVRSGNTTTATNWRYWLRARDQKNNWGATTYVDITINRPSTPTVSAEVIDNNVLLKWTDSETDLPLRRYEIRKTTTSQTFDNSTTIGKVQGLFSVIFEDENDDYKYYVAAFDSSGVRGVEGSITATVDEPPDYQLKRRYNTDFSGTKTNAYLSSSDNNLYVCLNTTETIQEHFVNNSYATPQAQIDDGKDRWLMPSQTTGQYQETFDYGTVLAGTKIQLTPSYGTEVGSTTKTPKIEFRKTSSDSWTVHAGKSSVYATNFRYVRFTYDFASSGGNDILEVSNILLKLAMKSKNDAGSGYIALGTGTYSQTGVNITITQTAHGLTAGNHVTLDFTSGSATDGTFEVATVPNANSFTVVAASSASNTGNVTLNPNGAPVDFTRTFVDINGVSANANAHGTFKRLDNGNVVTAPICLTSFDDQPDPSEGQLDDFTVFMYDPSDGQPVKGPFTWQARGT